jgi:dnd system-associated protein 4
MRSIYRSKAHAPLIEKLQLKDPKTGVAAFPTIKALLCYAAMLGFDQKRREPFDRKDTENIEWHTFNNDGYTQYIYLIALAETKSINVLNYDVENSQPAEGEDDMVRIFEEYANGGLSLLETWINKTPGDPYGAKAIVNGLSRANYLVQPQTEQSFDEVEF